MYMYIGHKEVNVFKFPAHCHCCSSSGKLSTDSDLYFHDHHPMAAPVDQSNLI